MYQLTENDIIAIKERIPELAFVSRRLFNNGLIVRDDLLPDTQFIASSDCIAVSYAANNEIRVMLDNPTINEYICELSDKEVANLSKQIAQCIGVNHQYLPPQPDVLTMMDFRVSLDQEPFDPLVVFKCPLSSLTPPDVAIARLDYLSAMTIMAERICIALVYDDFTKWVANKPKLS